MCCSKYGYCGVRQQYCGYKNENDENKSYDGKYRLLVN
jgi:hypothetical protein